MNDLPLQPIAQQIWDDKYRLKRPDGTSDEANIADTNARVVRGVYAKDDNKAQRNLAEAAMNGRCFLPAGRISAGAGTGKNVTLINCYVINTIGDSMRDEDGKPGIMSSLANSAYTMQMGGGTGQDFSPLRPRGALVKKLGAESSGPISFMDMWHAMCGTIMSAGFRRGAMMATLRIDHPDIWNPKHFERDHDGRLIYPSFISAKQEKGRLTNFNLSILVTNEFMKALEADDIWDLGHEVPPAKGDHVGVRLRDDKHWYVYRQIKARDLWDIILKSTYEYAEPGVIFIDRINAMNNLWYCETISCTNPCGEQPLPPYGQCDLGHVNLEAMVDEPFTPKASINWDRLETTVRIGVRFLDNVLDVTNYPLEEQKQEALSKRRIGLGITGLGNMLQMLGLRYGSPEAIKRTDAVMAAFRDFAYRASIQLAKERGPFPLFKAKDFMLSMFVKELPNDIREDIKQFGIRNGVLTSIAPVGTGSLWIDNVSGGLEPTFGWEYFRKVLQPNGTYKEYKVEDHGWRVYKNVRVLPDDAKPENLPDYMVTALELSVEDHVKMQAVCQRYIDASISKTNNCPADMTFEDFKKVYQLAWDTGCKGCTTYRPSGVRGAVLSMESQEKKPVKQETTTAPSREYALEGKTYKVKWPAVDHAHYVTINNYDNKPYEIFINSKDVEHEEYLKALTRMISAVYRNVKGDVSFVHEELMQIHSANGGAWVDGEYVPSFVAYLGRVIGDHVKPSERKAEDNKEKANGALCPKCHRYTLLKMQGCSSCPECGYEKCG